jgi:hypothetical protein
MMILDLQFYTPEAITNVVQDPLYGPLVRSWCGLCATIEFGPKQLDAFVRDFGARAVILNTVWEDA